MGRTSTGLQHCVASDNGVSFPEIGRDLLQCQDVAPMTPNQCKDRPQCLIQKIQMEESVADPAQGIDSSNIGTSINVKRNNPRKEGN